MPAIEQILLEAIEEKRQSITLPLEGGGLVSNSQAQS
jgi:hypothetical protein